MTALWLTLAFIAGVLAWHYFGLALFRKAAGRPMMAASLRGIETGNLIRLSEQVTDEIARRKQALQ